MVERGSNLRGTTQPRMRRCNQMSQKFGQIIIALKLVFINLQNKSSLLRYFEDKTVIWASMNNIKDSHLSLSFPASSLTPDGAAQFSPHSLDPQRVDVHRSRTNSTRTQSAAPAHATDKSRRIRAAGSRVKWMLPWGAPGSRRENPGTFPAEMVSAHFLRESVLPSARRREATQWSLNF